MAEQREVRRGGGRYCNIQCLGQAKTLRMVSDELPANTSKGRNARARKIWIYRHGGALPVCHCGAMADVHHKDGDNSNNAEENHEPLCRSHHVSHENTINPKRRKSCARSPTQRQRP